MLHLIPAPVQRALMPLAHRVRKVWVRMARRDIYGVAVMAFDARDRLLLVRHSYGTRAWSMPAGGMGHGEDPSHAIRREMREELDVTLDDLQLVSQRVETIHGVSHHVWLYTARVNDPPQPDMREVIEARFFTIDELPEALEKRVRPRLALMAALE
ncbi:NUDIX domain-containing protein [Erythrobacter arachoides]|uniref:NUDIX domain-containing protein n=1 Tax=Aurantiacibacter arachoides TaxID=1850444 RepID=A0A845A1K3_9SPHN|nr:NUDIX domain-containing protein [Aurantiacibacter arachoides]MXO94015.1 NUDIX domain-containing protein [Aurantiacibacter arachoides]GGD44737.1 NUDIX hydrolase [Aurantiacibacter arachoides]